MDAEIIKRKDRELFRHVKALEAAQRCDEYVTRLIEQYDVLDKIIKSALFTSVIIQYGRIFKGNERKGKLEFYPIKKLKETIAFDETIHNELLTIRDRFVAHQDWDVEGRGLARSFASGEVNGTSFNFIVEQSVVVTSLAGIKMEHLKIWQGHIEAICKGLFKLADGVLSELVSLGGERPDLFKMEDAIQKEIMGETKLSTQTEILMPTVRGTSFPNLLEKSTKVIGSKYYYRHMTLTRLLDEIKVNRGTPEEVTINISRRKSRS
jgi:hypothetical protein